MSSLSVIFDGNYIMNRSLFTYESRGARKLGTEEDRGTFVRKLATDVAYTVRSLGNVSRVIWTIDKNSWRKQIPIDNEGYKKNRVYADDVDWNAFHKLNYEFGEILEKNGCICSVIDGCEGDDLIYFWSKELYDIGEDVVIVTGDRDTNQLVKFDNGHFISVYNVKASGKKMITAKGAKEYIDTPDEIGLFNFSAMSSNKAMFKGLLEKDVEIEEVDPEDVLFEKIVVGDTSDNVPPIISWEETQKSGKVVRRKITDTKAEIIKENIICNEGKIDVEHIEQYSDIFSEKIKEFYKKEISGEDVKKALERNKTLVWLNEQVIPFSLKEKFYEHFIENKENGHPLLSNWRMNVLLEGTKYYTEEKQIEVEADIFKAPKKKASAKKKNDVSVDSLYNSLF